MIKKRIIVFLMGPSGIGKTSLSLKLYNLFNFDIINVDSSMIYKKMNIGTGKPDALKLKHIKHNLTNIINTNEKYSVFNFCIDAYFLIQNAISKNKIPLLVGGNMMYNWFYQNYLFSKYFYKDLINEYQFLNIVLIPNNKKYMNFYIKKRFLYMLKTGIIEETQKIYINDNLNLNSKSINSIGYKDIWLYLENKIKFNDVKNLIIKSTQNLSKRQITWIKKWHNDVYYFEMKNKNTVAFISTLIKKYLY
ncbi:MAG TPA: tRNA (adenosine(37)-N6)-dimethylallyltransferase [Candidatus Azoamicus sp.]